ncbi:MAG: BrnT family toxin [Serratia marcescens]|nr:BrnT family toxin [Serratia marcescens]MDU3650283.1 BrnT family toxin [Serratia marcescens]
MYVYFEWNQDKNHSNQRKHRVSFEIAQRVFLDPNHFISARKADAKERGRHEAQKFRQKSGP